MVNHIKTLHWFFSITTALIFYALFLFVFTPVSLDLRPKNKNSKSIYMLPVSDTMSERGKNLAAWMKNEDPTLIVLPNRKYNYSKILLDEKKFNFNDVAEDLSFLKNKRENFNTEIQIKKITSPVITDNEKFMRYELYSYPVLPEFPFVIKKRRVQYPCFRDYYSGKVIPVKFPISLKIDELIKKYDPQKNTLLDVEGIASANFFPFVRIISSCGVDELDKLAVNNIITQVNTDKNYFNEEKLVTVVVEWNKF